ncbi:hypothetical protein R5W24_005839 [Gemmata sp. JC717]|uniref:hypothetical protein n=1 Tax=Gemmata algarum TaxID=2975278 RepID=UPI0021BB4135|nr:hypothetical protein [Gemmata algarum]MDY3556669.1 hypothetical protein [Gemmata algarum]
MNTRLTLLAVALAVTGCGDPKPLPMAATPESSRAALVGALDAWKAGKTPQDLAAGSPPVLFVDDDINRSKLADYKIEGDGLPKGTGYSYTVSLTLADKDAAKTRAKKVAYTVVTEPRLAITKEDRQP